MQKFPHPYYLARFFLVIFHLLTPSLFFLAVTLQLSLLPLELSSVQQWSLSSIAIAQIKFFLSFLPSGAKYFFYMISPWTFVLNKSLLGNKSLIFCWIVFKMQPEDISITLSNFNCNYYYIRICCFILFSVLVLHTFCLFSPPILLSNTYVEFYFTDF